MPRTAEVPEPFLEMLRAVGPGAPGIDDKLRLLQSLRAPGDAAARGIDRFLVEEVTCVRAGLAEAKANQESLKAVLKKLAAVPWHPAVFIETVTTGEGPRLVVIHGSARRIVGAADGVDAGALRRGDEVFLSNELNVVIARSPNNLPTFGELAAFERLTPDGRLVLRRRGDEEVVVDAAACLQTSGLSAGDLVRWSREFWLAFEKLPRPDEKRFVIEDLPDVGPEAVGGQEAALELLLSALTARLIAPDKAALYGLNGQASNILMCGPPGCGKTLMARVVAVLIRQISGKRCYFAVVKPGEFEDPFVGVTQQNIRNCFEALRRAADEGGFAILFLDEIESVGRIRGGLASAHSDKFLAAFLAEIDGFAGRSNVAVVAATNRKDLLDAALLERFDLEIPVQRPNMLAARRIFEIHLPETLTYRSNGEAGVTTRRQMIDAAVARFYAPNADNELCTLRFRDGTTRTIAARELASGRCFEQVCRAARRTAFLRDLRGGTPGVCVEDMQAAVTETLRKLATTLTPRNAHAYLPDLPQDLDVVSVEPMVRKVAAAHRYLNVA